MLWHPERRTKRANDVGRTGATGRVEIELWPKELQGMKASAAALEPPCKPSSNESVAKSFAELIDISQSLWPNYRSANHRQMNHATKATAIKVARSIKRVAHLRRRHVCLLLNRTRSVWLERTSNLDVMSE